MPKITSLEPQVKNNRRFNIFIDGKFAFGADEDLVVENRIVVGKEISPEDLEKLLFETEVGKLMERVYGQLSIRQRSEKEIRDYLKRLSFKRKIKDQDELSEVTIELLISKLKAKGLINDLEFAKAWVESRRKSKQKGINALKAELYQKGIEREIVEEVVSCHPSVVSEEELAKIALEKKMRIWKNLPPEELKKKAINFLMRKGFEYELVRCEVEKRMEKE
jgi:regulatory protein